MYIGFWCGNLMEGDDLEMGCKALFGLICLRTVTSGRLL